MKLRSNFHNSRTWSSAKIFIYRWFNGYFLSKPASQFWFGLVANHHRLEGASTKYLVPRNFVDTILWWYATTEQPGLTRPELGGSDCQANFPAANHCSDSRLCLKLGADFGLSENWVRYLVDRYFSNIYLSTLSAKGCAKEEESVCHRSFIFRVWG